MKPSELLLEQIRRVKQAYAPVDLANPICFIRNLIFVYHTSAATENMIGLAAEKSDGELREYFLQHLAEERGHEKWLSEDLRTVGVDVKKAAIAPEAVAMAGTQYYLIHHVHPAALLGYMAMLECFPMPADAVDALERIHGKALCHTLRYHSLHDIDHGADVLTVIDKLPESLLPLVFDSAIQTAHYLGSASAKFAHTEN